MAHHIYFPGLEAHAANNASGGSITIEGDEAHHAVRVRRLVAGDAVILSDGAGHQGHAHITLTEKSRGGWRMVLSLERVDSVAKPSPRVVVYAAAAKGDRLEDMVDGLSQVGAAAFAPLVTRRSIADPRQAKDDRLRRVAVEAMKQCGRAWTMDIGPSTPFRETLSQPGLVMADASGEPYAASGQRDITLLIGPEGGWTDEERAAAREAGARTASFGPHIMRIEVASVAAAAIILHAERRPPPV